MRRPEIFLRNIIYENHWTLKKINACWTVGCLMPSKWHGPKGHADVILLVFNWHKSPGMSENAIYFSFFYVICVMCSHGNGCAILFLVFIGKNVDTQVMYIAMNISFQIKFLYCVRIYQLCEKFGCVQTKWKKNICWWTLQFFYFLLYEILERRTCSPVLVKRKRERERLCYLSSAFIMTENCHTLLQH